MLLHEKQKKDERNPEDAVTEAVEIKSMNEKKLLHGLDVLPA